MPNPKKPAALKAISGTVQKCRVDPVAAIAIAAISYAPPPPDWLNKLPEIAKIHALKEWTRLMPVLVSNKLLTEGGISALALLCALHGHIVESWLDGECPPATILAQYRGLANDFGLTPMSQSKVKATNGDDKKSNPFARNGIKPA